MRISFSFPNCLNFFKQGTISSVCFSRLSLPSKLKSFIISTNIMALLSIDESIKCLLSYSSFSFMGDFKRCGVLKLEKDAVYMQEAIRQAKKAEAMKE